MPINCLINCLVNSEQSCSKNQFMVNSWTIHEHSCFKKTALSPFIFCLFAFQPFVFGSSAAQNGGLSLFNTRPVRLANTLKTKDLRKRHFWLKILSPGKPLRLKTLGVKFAHYFSHFPADPTLHTPPKSTPHTPPRNPTPCKVSCRICRPNPTHPTPLIIKS